MRLGCHLGHWGEADGPGFHDALHIRAMGAGHETKPLGYTCLSWFAFVLHQTFEPSVNRKTQMCNKLATLGLATHALTYSALLLTMVFVPSRASRH